MKLKIYNYNSQQIADVEVSDQSDATFAIMQSGRLTLHFKSKQVINFTPSSWCQFEGVRFILVYPEKITKLWKGYYEYTVIFHTEAELTKMKLVKDPSNVARTSFVFTGNPREFATLIARSLGNEWSVGQCIDSSYNKTIAFKQDSCWSALGRVAQEFDTEWVIQGYQISFKKHELNATNPLKMSYGKGKGFVTGVSRQGSSDQQAIGRLYVLGGRRNIDYADYGDSALHLPRSWSDGRLRTDENGKYIEFINGNGNEGAVELTEIYPHRKGTVSGVVTVNAQKNFYDIIDGSIPESLNFNDYRIPQEKASIKFETGALAGREFDIKQTQDALTGYHHSERRIEIVPAEHDGIVMPSAEWMPAVGDKYAIFGIKLPHEYMRKAEMDLLSEAIKKISDENKVPYTFDGKVDGIWSKSKWLEVGGILKPGGYIFFIDEEFHPQGTPIRITSVRYQVNSPHTPDITLSNTSISGTFSNKIDSISANDVIYKKQIDGVVRHQRYEYQQALEAIGMIEKAMTGVEDFTAGIKPSVMQTMAILIGSQSSQFDFVTGFNTTQSANFWVYYNQASQCVEINSAYIRHQTLGITSLSNARNPTDYRYWYLDNYISPALTDAKSSYYIYAKVERNGSKGYFLLSEEPKNFEGENCYLLLIGTLSSEIEGSRVYNRLYGVSMLTPGQMLVDLISSASGGLTIDLIKSEIICEMLKFRRPQDGEILNAVKIITDVDNVINALLNGIVNDRPALEFLVDMYNKGASIAQMGILFAKAMLFSNSKDNVTAYINGDNSSNIPFVEAGINNFGSANQSSTFSLYHDGSFRVGTPNSYLKYTPDVASKFGLTLFGSGLNMPGVLYIGTFVETGLRPVIGGIVNREFEWGQLANTSKKVKMIFTEQTQEFFKYTVLHYAGTVNYIPIVISNRFVKYDNKLDNSFDAYFDTAFEGSEQITIMIAGKNLEAYD